MDGALSTRENAEPTLGPRSTKEKTLEAHFSQLCLLSGSPEDPFI